MIDLRELRRGDAPGVQMIYSGKSVLFLGRDAMSEEEAAAYIDRAEFWAGGEPRRQYIVGVDVGSDLVGILKLNVVCGVGRLGYVLRQNAWGNGFATAAVTDLLALAFGGLSLSAVHAKHQVENRASGRVLLKAGFTNTGTTEGMSHCTATLSPPLQHDDSPHLDQACWTAP